MTVRCHWPLTWPRIPQDILDAVLARRSQRIVMIKDTGYDQDHKRPASSYCFDLVGNTALESWARQQVQAPITHIEWLWFGLQTQEAGAQATSTHIVHVDDQRSWSLFYLLESGGTSVRTTWYWEQNRELRRPKWLGGRQVDDAPIVNYDNLTEIDHAELKEHTWYLLRSDVLHDVQGITNQRRSLSVKVQVNDLLEHSV